MQTSTNGIIKKTPIESVLLSLCTCKRPNQLRECLLSVNKLIIPENLKVEVLVIDNDVEETGRPIVEELKETVKLPINYGVEPQRGLANARNRSLEESIKLDASHILMFDDDEVLTENTLVAHVNMYNTNEQAVIVSGPAPNLFKDSYPNYIKKSIVFKQKYFKKHGAIRPACPTNNVFFPTTLIKEYGLRFSTKYVYMGGEDGDFFNRASKLGFTIVWNKDAIINEIVSPARATLNYVFKKSYYNGYAGAFHRFKDNKNILKQIIYVLKTALLVLINCVILIPSILFGATCFFNVIARSIRAIGKINGAISTKASDFYKNIYGE